MRSPAIIAQEARKKMTQPTQQVGPQAKYGLQASTIHNAHGHVAQHMHAEVLVAGLGSSNSSAQIHKSI